MGKLGAEWHKTQFLESFKIELIDIFEQKQHWTKLTTEFHFLSNHNLCSKCQNFYFKSLKLLFDLRNVENHDIERQTWHQTAAPWVAALQLCQRYWVVRTQALKLCNWLRVLRIIWWILVKEVMDRIYRYSKNRAPPLLFYTIKIILHISICK